MSTITLESYLKQKGSGDVVEEWEYVLDMIAIDPPLRRRNISRQYGCNAKRSLLKEFDLSYQQQQMYEHKQEQYNDRKTRRSMVTINPLLDNDLMTTKKRKYQ